MEEREGILVSYDGAAKTAVITDSYSGGSITVLDIGNIGAGNNPPIPAGAGITYIVQYIPPRGNTGAEQIKNILVSVKVPA